MFIEEEKMITSSYKEEGDNKSVKNQRSIKAKPRMYGTNFYGCSRIPCNTCCAPPAASLSIRHQTANDAKPAPVLSTL
jgi:hypothetical protein